MSNLNISAKSKGTTSTNEQTLFTTWVNTDSPENVKPSVFPKVLYYKDPSSKFTQQTLHAFDPDNVVYSIPKPAKMGGLVVMCKYQFPNGPLVPLKLVTPPLRAPFGFVVSETEQTQRGSVALALDDDEEESRSFRDIIQYWDANILKEASKQRNVWFTTNPSNDVLRYLYAPMARFGKKKKDNGMSFSPLFNVKIPLATSSSTAMTPTPTYNINIYDGENKPVTAEIVGKRSRLSIFCEHTGIWFQAKSFSSCFQGKQAKMYPASLDDECVFSDITYESSSSCSGQNKRQKQEQDDDNMLNELREQEDEVEKYISHVEEQEMHK